MLSFRCLSRPPRAPISALVQALSPSPSAALPTSKRFLSRSVRSSLHHPLDARAAPGVQRSGPYVSSTCSRNWRRPGDLHWLELLIEPLRSW
eukprot:1142734-Pyramimonas_sp.AAC.1